MFPGWNFHEVLYYFKKSEDNEDKEIFHSNPKYHGKGGYQTVEWFPYVDPNVPYLIHAWKEMGLMERDLNAEMQIGVMHLQSTARHGERLSTNGAYIRPIRKKRKNLTVMTQAHVTRVLVDRKLHEAVGVEFVKEGHLMTVMAKKEVILSAGAINSPQILMVSGIGPAYELAKHKINMIKHLPVRIFIKTERVTLKSTLTILQL